MISVLLMILKIIGIVLLALLGIVFAMALLVLFVPVRYRILAHRRAEDETPVTVSVKVTWLLHIVNAALAYPGALYLRVRVLCFTVYRSDKRKKSAAQKEDRKKRNSVGEEHSSQAEPDPEKEEKNTDSLESGNQKTVTEEQPKEEGTRRKIKKTAETQNEGTEEETGPEKREEKHREGEEEKRTALDFLKKIISLLKNIQYTITGICDKIKHIVKNIRYYVEIIKSDTFRRAWTVCSGEAFSLLKHILPGKFSGNLRIGTGDPAGTGEVLAVYGILYPLLGNHIDITPDFEERVVEGDLFIRGRITVFRALKTAWILFFNKDLRRLIKLLKREAV